MADKKISALTGASTPLAGTEVLPIVQNGATVNVSVANLTAGRAVAMAGGSFTDNITQSTAAKGINFTANTPAAGMTSQLLDDYEEGTFTLTDPGVKDAVSGTWTFVSGIYTKIGRQVTVNATFSGTGLGFSANTGYYRFDGLPFTSAASYSGTWQGPEAFKATAGFVFTAGDRLWLHAAISTQTSDSGIIVTATYTV
jgi:hypothetical protein